MNTERDVAHGQQAGEREEDGAREEEYTDTTFDPGLHNMGGAVGPASIRGSNATPGGSRDDDAEPSGGYARPMGYVAGRDDEWPETAGSDEKAVGARTDEIEGHVDTFGPSPHPVRQDSAEQRAHGGRPGFRVRGPAAGEEPGVIDEEEPRPDAETTDPAVALPTAGTPRGGGHVSADVGWAGSDEDDPDSGSGRTDADDGGYLPGEGTGRPYRE